MQFQKFYKTDGEFLKDFQELIYTELLYLNKKVTNNAYLQLKINCHVEQEGTFVLLAEENGALAHHEASSSKN